MLDDPSVIYDEFPLASMEVSNQIADLIVRVAYYNDRGKYELLAEYLAPEIIVDAVSLFGGEVETVSREEQIRRYKSFLPGCDFNQHLVTCAEVRILGAGRAIAWSNFRATHCIDEDKWTAAGIYTHELQATETHGWQITAIKIDLGYEEGTRAVLEKAGERVALRSGS
jgi:SnoaL-like domain